MIITMILQEARVQRKHVHLEFTQNSLVGERGKRLLLLINEEIKYLL